MLVSAPLRSPILVGRDDLLELASRRLAEADRGRGGLVLLAGEAGVGKSRLISAFDRKARAAGFRTAAGLVAPQDRDVPAASLLDLARTVSRVPAFERLGGDLLDLLGSAAAAHPAGRRALVFKAVDLLADDAAEGDEPTMLAFDDVQWADDLSLEIVAELARRARERRLLLVAAYRSDEVAPGSLVRDWRSRLLTQRMAEEVRLGPLTFDETAMMATLILSTGLPVPRDVARAVYERTDGVPLHVEELLGALTETERVDSRAILESAVPDTLEDAILQRVSRLSAAAQAVARAGAVIGRSFDPEVLASVMELAIEELDSPLHELLAHQFLDRRGEAGLHDYRHQVLRDALYGSVPERERQRLHARAAEFGGALEGASEIHASLHYERAGLAAKAYRSAIRGAEEAARLSSHREAYDLYRRAVANLPPDLPARERAQVLERFANEALAIEDSATSEEAIGEARELYRQLGDATAAASLLPGLIGAARREARPLDVRRAQIEAALEEAAALRETPAAVAIRARIALEDGTALLDAMDLAAASTALDGAGTMAAELGDQELGLQVALLVGMVDVLLGDDAGLERMFGVAREARQLGYEDPALTAYREASVMAARVMEPDRARAWIAEGLEYADSIQQTYCAHVMSATGGLVEWLDGRWDEAIRSGRQALADRGWARASDIARWPLGYTAFGRGEIAEAREQLEGALAFAERSGIPDFVLASLWGLAEAALVEGDPLRAIELSERALETATASGERARFVPFVVTGTRAMIAAGRPADAGRWLARAAKHVAPDRRLAGAALDHASGLIAVAEGTLVAGRGALERAVRGWDERGRTWEALWARLDLASCLMRSNRHVDARGLLVDVGARAQDLGSRPVLDRVRELERLARAHGAEDRAWHPLTVREFEVARQIAAGMTNAEIAAELFVSPKTVSAHVEHILAKLGANRRAEIATWVATIAQPVVA